MTAMRAIKSSASAPKADVVEQLSSASFRLVSESLAACGGDQALTLIVPPDIPSSSAKLLTFKPNVEPNPGFGPKVC